MSQPVKKMWGDLIAKCFQTTTTNDNMEFTSASTSKKGRPGTVAPVNVPHYDEIECDANGSAIIPVNFLPGLVNNLPADWYYVIYSYYKYFDREQ